MLLAFSVFAKGGGSRKTKHDAEVSLGDEGGKPPSLHLAAYHGSCGALEAELKHTQAAGVNQPDQKGMSALQIAVARGGESWAAVVSHRGPALHRCQCVD